jgi:hypothetical protein
VTENSFFAVVVVWGGERRGGDGWGGVGAVKVWGYLNFFFFLSGTNSTFVLQSYLCGPARTFVDRALFVKEERG